MRRRARRRLSFVAAGSLFLGLLVWPTVNGAQGNRIRYSGQATAVRGTLLRRNVVVSDTGPLPNSGGALEATLFSVNFFGLLSAEIFHASTVGQGDRTLSEASGASLALQGNTVTAEFIRAAAAAICTSGGVFLEGGSEIADLAVNGRRIVVTGELNQTIALRNGQIIVNEQTSSLGNRTGEIAVNGLHIIVNGIADFVFSSARAGITCRGRPPRQPEDFVTGGGWIRGTPSGSKANFSVAGGIKQGDFWGHLTYNDKGPNGPKVQGTGVTGYVVVNATTRRIQGTAEIDGQGGFTYEVEVTDNGEPGRNDIFTIRLSNGYTASSALGGGNIQLHD